MYWSVQTALRPSRTSTDKVVYAPVACRNSLATSSSGVGSIWGRFAPFIFRPCSTGQPTSCHELRSPESGDSTRTVQLIWRCFGLAQEDLFASLETSHCQLFYSLTEGTLGTDALAQTHWHTAGRGAFASMHFPQWAFSHRQCARSERKKSRSCSWRHTGSPGLGSQSWCS